MRSSAGAREYNPPADILHPGGSRGVLPEPRLSWVTDKTNLSTDYTRNKIRHIILPEMLKINGSLFSTMNRMEQSLRDDSDFLDDMARQTLSEAETTVRLRTPGEEDIWELQPAWSAEKLAKLPKPVQSRAIKLILQSGGIEPSALRINTAREIIASGKGKFNPAAENSSW